MSGDVPRPEDLVGAARAVELRRGAVGALADGLDPAMVDDALGAALATHDARAFTALMLAAAHRGPPPAARWLAEGAELLAFPEALAAMAGHVDGDAAEALLAAVRRGRMGADREPVALLLAECWVRRQGADRPSGLVPAARIRARRELDQAGEDALIALAALVDDPHLELLLADLATAEVKQSAQALASELVDWMLGPVLQVLPERRPRRSASRRPVRRAAAKIGRNDACWCGSGKKYKQCHEAEDRRRLADSSDVAGITEGELGASREVHLDAERLWALRGHELAALEPAKVPVPLRPLLVEILGMWGYLDEALAALPTVTDPAVRPAIIDVLVWQRVREGRADDVTSIAKRTGTPKGDLPVAGRLQLARNGAERLRILEEAAVRELDSAGVELGLALLLGGLPALGIHVARSQLLLRQPDGGTADLYEALLEARDLLQVPPFDQVDDVLYLLEQGIPPEMGEELVRVRKQLDGSEAALRSTQEALERVRVELEQQEDPGPRPDPREVPSPPAPRPVVDDSALRSLRDRVEHLKAELKTRHRERNALRRDLEVVRERVGELEAAEPEEAPHDDDEPEDEVDSEAVDAVAAQVRIPVFPDDFDAQLARVPDATARTALVRLGNLCAGYAHAFRECRPMRGIPGTWRVKVGRSYRLLFRPDDGLLHVIELVHRQQLESRLARLRATRE